MKKKPAELTELGAQLEKLRGAIEDARRGRERRAPRTQALRPARGTQPESVGEARGPRSSFVEFSGAQLMDAPAGTVIEWACATGVRLTIRLAAGQLLDVAALAALFRGVER